MPPKESESLDKKMARITRERHRRGPRKLKTPRTPEAVPPNTRKRVGETLTSGVREADRGAQRPSEIPRHLLEFEGLIESNDDFKDTFHSISMVCNLADNSYKNRNLKIFEDTPFTEENMRKLMQAIFCEAKGDYVRGRVVKRTLTQEGVTFLATIYKDLLGLKPHSTKTEKQQAIEDFIDKMGRFPELLAYDEQKKVTGALKIVTEEVAKIEKKDLDPEEENSLIDKKKRELIASLEFADSKPFDEEVIDERLAYYKAKADEEDGKSPSAPVVTPASTPPAALEEKAGEPIDFEVFLRDEVAKSPEIRAAYMSLHKLYLAFSNPEDNYDRSPNRKRNFDGDDWNTMAGNISEALDDNDLTQALYDAARNASEARKDDPKGSAYKWALIKAVADYYKISDKPEALKNKLIKISEILTKTYKNIGKRKKK